MSLGVIEGGDGLPPEPDWSAIFSDELDVEAARGKWGVVTREMQAAGTLAVANGDAIRRLVEFWVEYQRSARHVAEHGAILPPKSRKTKVGQWNPHWSVMRQADQSIGFLEAELGLSPTRRGKAVKVQRGKKASRASDEFIKPVSG